MLAFGGSGAIFHGWSEHEQNRLIGGCNAMVEVAFYAQLTFGSLSYSCSDYGQRTSINCESGGLSGSIMGHEHGTAGFVGLHTVQEAITPCLSRSHLHQMFDVDSRNDGATGAELFAGLGLDAHTSSTF